jgi:hypothetical protein
LVEVGIQQRRSHLILQFLGNHDALSLNPSPKLLALISKPLKSLTPEDKKKARQFYEKLTGSSKKIRNDKL